MSLSRAVCISDMIVLLEVETGGNHFALIETTNSAGGATYKLIKTRILTGYVLAKKTIQCERRMSQAETQDTWYRWLSNISSRIEEHKLKC